MHNTELLNHNHLKANFLFSKFARITRDILFNTRVKRRIIMNVVAMIKNSDVAQKVKWVTLLIKYAQNQTGCNIQFV